MPDLRQATILGWVSYRRYGTPPLARYVVAQINDQQYVVKLPATGKLNWREPGVKGITVKTLADFRRHAAPAIVKCLDGDMAEQAAGVADTREHRPA